MAELVAGLIVALLVALTIFAFRRPVRLFRVFAFTGAVLMPLLFVYGGWVLGVYTASNVVEHSLPSDRGGVVKDRLSALIPLETPFLVGTLVILYLLSIAFFVWILRRPGIRRRRPRVTGESETADATEPETTT
jgi:uncharacterized membrane protein YqjE